MKLGRKSKLLDQVIGWGGGSHRTQQAGRPGQHRVQGLTGEGATWLGISWDGLSVCWYGSGYGVWVLRTPRSEAGRRPGIENILSSRLLNLDVSHAMDYSSWT